MHAQIHAHSWIDHHFILPRRAAPTVMQATAGIRAPPPVLHACVRARHVRTIMHVWEAIVGDHLSSVL